MVGVSQIFVSERCLFLRHPSILLGLNDGLSRQEEVWTSFLLRSLNECKGTKKDINAISKWGNADIDKSHQEPPDAWVVLTCVHCNHPNQLLEQPVQQHQTQGLTWCHHSIFSSHQLFSCSLLLWSHLNLQLAKKRKFKQIINQILNKNVTE